MTKMESWKSYENGGDPSSATSAPAATETAATTTTTTTPTTTSPTRPESNDVGESGPPSTSSLEDKSPDDKSGSNVSTTSVAAANASTSTNDSPNSSASTSTTVTTNAVGPDPEKLKAILERTHYTHQVTAGQRKYGGPPPDWTGTTPPAGAEVFVGRIPKDVFEDELIPIFEKIGQLWDLRLMIDPNGSHSRGYAFITYTNKEDAHRAVQELNGYKIQHKNVTLKVNISVPNLRLFIGNIPKIMSKEQIFNEFNKITEGLIEVITYSPPEDHKKNRGFCFLEFDSHKNASAAKRKLTTSGMKIFKCDILVDWADPQEEPDEETMSKVKVLYVRNLTSQVTEAQLKDLFHEFGPIDRVKKIKDYAFVHFDDRDKALRAMESLNGKEFGGSNIEISLAKPPSDRRKKEEMLRNRERRMYLMLQQKQLMSMSFPRGSPMPLRPPMQPIPPMLAPPVMSLGRNRNRFAQPMNPIQPVAPYGRQGQPWMPMPYYQDPSEWWFNGRSGPGGQSFPYGGMPPTAAAQWAAFSMHNGQLPAMPFGGPGVSRQRSSNPSNSLSGSSNLGGAPPLNGNASSGNISNLQHSRKWRKSNGAQVAPQAPPPPPRNK